MTRIDPDPDIYGKEIRASALADYVELLTLASRPTKRALLSDFISDNGWRLSELVVPVGGGQEGDPDDEDESAERVYRLLEERKDLLGDAYPFSVDRETLLLRDGIDVVRSPYLALLAISTLHAYRVGIIPPPHEVFEDLVSSVISSRIEPSICFSRLRRNSGSFPEALERAGTRLGLLTDASAGPRRVYGQDEKTDTIGHLTWADSRAGCWVFLGQATCARSEAWNGKLTEVRSGSWALFLGTKVPPVVFLAIPHHAESAILQELVIGHKRLVLDRIRLARFKRHVNEEEAALIIAMQALELQPI